MDIFGLNTNVICFFSWENLIPMGLIESVHKFTIQVRLMQTVYNSSSTNIFYLQKQIQKGIGH